MVPILAGKIRRRMQVNIGEKNKFLEKFPNDLNKIWQYF